jgi:aspartyl aminopeptidase
MSHLLEDLRSFLDNSPTSWHAGLELGNRLALKEFTPLDEREKWLLEPGKRYFVLRGGSLCAFTLPAQAPQQALILASHTDSPALKLKPHAESIRENMLFLCTEGYGTPLLSSWLNRDLGIAGRLITADQKGNLEERLIYIDDAPLFIPQLAIHLDREVNEKGLLLNRQEHLLACATLLEGPMEKGYLETLMRRHLAFHTLVSSELFLVPIEESRFLGSRGELLASYRLDNLASCHALAVALVSAPSTQHLLQMGLFWDHEEVGSRSYEGAASPFFDDVLQRIAYCLKLNEEDLLQLKSHSLCVSVDMAHAWNPNYPNKYDPNHSPLLGKGVVIKYNADQRYASSASTTARIIQTCRELGLPYQYYAMRSDLPCGSTVGPIFASSAGIATVDIGTPQLSMHSIREVIAPSDHLTLCRLLTELLKEKGS